MRGLPSAPRVSAPCRVDRSRGQAGDDVVSESIQAAATAA